MKTAHLLAETSAKSIQPCNSPFRKCVSLWTNFRNSTRKKRLSASLILLIWRLAALPLYYHHDLAVTIPDIQCWCFRARTPYGYLWYLIDYPLSYNYPLELTLVDFAVQLVIRNRSVYWPALVTSYFLYTAAPYDLPIMWLSLAGVYNPLLGLGLALLAKLPDTGPMWEFVLHKSTDVNDIEYYFLTAVPWLWITIGTLKSKWRERKLSIVS